ncbi:hypothetical protein E4T47_05112 [Aureobasidium subglaciale]|nr:hypothetical protein E4T47_05112 [Aureobasidium subglaciale]
MPPKRKGLVSYSDYVSGSEIETGPAKQTKKSPTKKLTFEEKGYGKGKAISDSETSGPEKKKAKLPPSRRRGDPSPTRRSTRATSKARQPPPPVEAPPLPNPPTTMSGARSQSTSRRGRHPSPSAMDPSKPPKCTRTVSPRKRLIEDSPPPEDKMDPFPKRRPPMTVTDKPAVRNRYGEKVPPPVDIPQKMRQALNFLSDEGVENCQDFEQKLAALEEWLRKNHPAMDGIIPDGVEDDERLCRRVEYMIWVHKRRIEEGADQWFSRDQFPNSKTFYKPIRPGKNDGWRLNADGSMINRPEHAKLQVMVQQDRERAEKQRAEQAAKDAAATAAAAALAPKATSSSTSPAKQPVRSRSPAKQAAASSQDSAAADPDAPTRAKFGLPYPEVWHRKEAARFPYGETPYMERVYSNQIDADLARGRESREAIQAGSLYPIKKMYNNFLGMLPLSGGKNKTGPPYDPYKLPDVSDDFIDEQEQKHGFLGWYDKGTGDKRKAADAALQATMSPAKRTRSGGNAA